MERRTEQGTRNKEQGTRNKEQGTDNGRRRKGDDIAERLLDAVEGVRRLLPALEVDAASKHVAKQLWRAASGGGANYEEARSAESCADFVHKVRVATKELREARYWLQVLQRSDWIERGTADSLIAEIDQLVAILVASARTARSRALRALAIVCCLLLVPCSVHRFWLLLRVLAGERG
jgi:four helix bundle protein